MKYIIIIILAFILFQCKEKEIPIIEDPKTETVFQNKPCYDSTYFDTTIVMKKIQFPHFSIEAPEGTEYDWGLLNNHTWGGYIKYGCDSFQFEYGQYVTGKFDPSLYYRVDTVEVDGHEGKILYANFEMSNQSHTFLCFLITKDEKEGFRIRIHNTKYDYYPLKMFNSFKFGW